MQSRSSMHSNPGPWAPSKEGAGARAAILWTCLALGPGAPAEATAHDLLAAFIQHRVVIVAGAKHVDVTVQLTFFEEPSARERERIDANGDGGLSRAEIDAYVRQLGPELAAAVRLRTRGDPVGLTPLCAPELDLLGQDRAEGGRHRLTLRYFAPTPAPLNAGTEWVVEDRLWPDVPALGLLHTEGKDGCRLEAVPASGPVLPPVDAGEARLFTVRVRALPTSPIADSSPHPTPVRNTTNERYPTRHE